MNSPHDRTYGEDTLLDLWDRLDQIRCNNTPVICLLCHSCHVHILKYMLILYVSCESVGHGVTGVILEEDGKVQRFSSLSLMRNDLVK